VSKVVKDSEDEPDQLAVLAEMSRVTLALLGIWDFFRSKLEQRRDPGFRQALDFADELAWVCYQPAHARGMKEPPLVYLNSGASPFVLRRDIRFNAESLPPDLLGSDVVVRATEHAPFPVVGMPWYHVDHLPDAVVIGHEVGHAVESDLKLEDDLDAVIKQALAKRPKVEERIDFWNNWRSELFADVYGCLATGPAFVGALGDFIAAPAAEVRGEWPELSNYPPVAVRMRFNAHVLEKLGLAQEAEAIWSDCESAWKPLAARLDPYLKDAVLVAGGMLAAKLPALKGQTVTTLLSFDAERLKTARELVKKASAQQALGGVSDLRTLFTAVRLAYEADPKDYDRKPADKSVLVRLTGAIKAAVRDDYRAGEPKLAKADQTKRDKALADAGRRWFTQVRGSLSASAAARNAPR
jgi:hypothetical protein